ncbi:hypothetical protein CC2G_000108 [Coprinopsis cinerea AmutBmut pab1-1]|nr:hypothetical protein CC2G_000108 [Coprinopsis cinerea AmutBmut pab1-1]
MSRKRWVFRLSHSILLAGIIGGTHAQISIESSVMESSIPSTFLQTTPSPIDTPLPSSAKSEPSSVPGSFSSIVDPSSLTDALSSQTRRPTSTSSTARTTITLSGNIAVHGSSKQVPVVAGALASVVLVVAAFVIVRLLFLRRKRRRAWFLSHVAGRPPDPFVPPGKPKYRFVWPAAFLCIIARYQRIEFCNSFPFLAFIEDYSTPYTVLGRSGTRSNATIFFENGFDT